MEGGVGPAGWAWEVHISHTARSLSTSVEPPGRPSVLCMVELQQCTKKKGQNHVRRLARGFIFVGATVTMDASEMDGSVRAARAHLLRALGWQNVDPDSSMFSLGLVSVQAAILLESIREVCASFHISRCCCMSQMADSPLIMDRFTASSCPRTSCSNIPQSMIWLDTWQLSKSQKACPCSK